MRKKFKARKKLKFKWKFYLFLIIFLIFTYNLLNLKLSFIDSNHNLITLFLNSTSINNYSNDNLEKKNILNQVIDYVKINLFNTPQNILKDQLGDFNANLSSKETKTAKFLYEENALPEVYIYNSHQGEKYSYKYLEDYNITPDVLMASNMLKDKLENINVKTIVEENDILQYMKKNNLDHSGSYIASRYYLKQAIEKYTSVKLYIDLHRDAASYKATHVTINNKECAKVLFVIGLEYSTYENNLAVATQLNNIILKKYPTLTRGIMKKEGYGVNGVYNQDLNSNVILIEIGGNENNIDEVNNTLDIIAEVIGEYLNEKK